MNRTAPALQITIFVLLALSCSQKSNAPVLPDLSADSSVPITNPASNSHSPQLWGFWDVEWNPDAAAFEATPLRTAMFSCNVIKFINMSGSNLIIDVNSIVHETDWTDFDLDIGITHPFPGLEKFTGFDVMGVFMGEGSEIYPGLDGLLVAGSGNQLLLNPDGYTRRFNATEFGDAGLILPLQGYVPGAKGTSGYYPNAELNPYKYFADGLDAGEDEFAFLESNADNRGCFRPGSVNYRNFKVRLPINFLKFQYAVLANWEPNKNNPDPPDSLDDFPENANSQEAVAIKIVDSSDAWYVNETTYGGDISLDITPWDWSAWCSGIMEEYSITLYSPAWTGPFTVDMTPTVEAEHHYTFQASIPGSMLTANGDQPVWVEVDYPDYDYTSPVGVPNDATGQLTAYFKIEVNVLDHDPTVNPSDNFIYGFADSNFFEYEENAMNQQLFTNMLNLPMEGPYAQNKKVMYYEGRSPNPWQDYASFGIFVESLGYEWVYVSGFDDPLPLLDTTGVKMLIVATYFWNSNIEEFHPEEIQYIRDLLNGGGICILLGENASCYFDTHIMDQLITELNADFSFPIDGVYECFPYTDITPDPITVGVTEFDGKACGRFEVFGEGVSLIRGQDGAIGVYTAVCKSPWKG